MPTEPLHQDESRRAEGAGGIVAGVERRNRIENPQKVIKKSGKPPTKIPALSIAHFALQKKKMQNQEQEMKFLPRISKP